MLKARVQDPEAEIDRTFYLGSIELNAHPITMIERAFQAAQTANIFPHLDVADHRILKDETKGNTRTMVIDWNDGCEMPCAFTFTELTYDELKAATE